MSESEILWWLALAFTLYALLHSVLAARPCKAAMARCWPRLMPAYRLLYNALALLLLLPLLWLLWQWPGELLWRRPEWLRWLFDGLALAALLGFLHSLKSYDLSLFSGTAQWRRGMVEVDAGEGFQIGFWHRFVRHPWYSFALVLLWTRDMNAAQLLFYSLATLYFVIGSRLEEAKLVAQFGEPYRRYAARVPGLLPRPWRYLSAAEAERLLHGDGGAKR